MFAPGAKRIFFNETSNVRCHPTRGIAYEVMMIMKYEIKASYKENIKLKANANHYDDGAWSNARYEVLPELASNGRFGNFLNVSIVKQQNIFWIVRMQACAC